MAFVTEVETSTLSRSTGGVIAPLPPPPDAFRDAGRGAFHQWLEERAAAAAGRRERRAAAVDNLRDEVLGRVPSRSAKDLDLVLPPLPFLREDRPSLALPFFDPDAVEGYRSGSHDLSLCLEAGPARDVSGTACGLRDVADTVQALVDDKDSAAITRSMQDASAKLMPSPDVLQAQLACSASWVRLPQPTGTSSRPAKAFQRTSSLPALTQKGAAKPTAPVKELLPFQRPRAVAMRPEPWAPLLGARARRAEIEMHRRLRG
jgi:hypothetical protein